jgi:hypothetical protein
VNRYVPVRVGDSKLKEGVREQSRDTPIREYDLEMKMKEMRCVGRKAIYGVHGQHACPSVTKHQLRWSFI